MASAPAKSGSSQVVSSMQSVSAKKPQRAFHVPINVDDVASPSTEGFAWTTPSNNVQRTEVPLKRRLRPKKHTADISSELSSPPPEADDEDPDMPPPGSMSKAAWAISRLSSR